MGCDVYLDYRGKAGVMALSGKPSELINAVSSIYSYSDGFSFRLCYKLNGKNVSREFDRTCDLIDALDTLNDREEFEEYDT